MLENIRKPS